MTQSEFLDRLERALKGKVGDVEEILDEYREHFSRKLADGRNEAEIAERLESPELLAAQFAEDGGSPGKKSGFAVFGLSLLAIPVLSLSVVLFAWVAVLGALSLGCASLGVCLAFGLYPFAFIPVMPTAGGILFGLSLFALALLASMGTAYSFLFALQLDKAYLRWAAKRLGASGRPPLSASPSIKARSRRWIRALGLGALAVAGVAFVSGFAVLALKAGSLEFWHVWHWFG